MLAGALRPDERALLAHELTHHFLAGAFQRQPRWFAEGVAVSMESLGADVPGHAIVMGAPPEARLARARRSPVPAAALLAWDGTPGGRDALDWYAASWLLVDYLSSVRADAFAELQRRLVAGEPPDGAWRAAFPDHDPARAGALEALDDALAAHARGRLPAQTRELEVPVAIGYFEERIPAAEVHAIRLALWPHGPKKPVEALRAEVEETLAEDGAHPIALQYRAALWEKIRCASPARRSRPTPGFRAPGRSSRARSMAPSARQSGKTRSAARQSSRRGTPRRYTTSPPSCSRRAAPAKRSPSRAGPSTSRRGAHRSSRGSPPCSRISDSAPRRCRSSSAPSRRCPSARRAGTPAFEGKLDAYARQCRVASGAPAR